MAWVRFPLTYLLSADFVVFIQASKRYSKNAALSEIQEITASVVRFIH